VAFGRSRGHSVEAGEECLDQRRPRYQAAGLPGWQAARRDHGLAGAYHLQSLSRCQAADDMHRTIRPGCAVSRPCQANQLVDQKTTLRRQDQVRSLFGALEVVEPGVVALHNEVAVRDAAHCGAPDMVEVGCGDLLQSLQGPVQ
jgi:hypothetical protein